MAHQILGSQNWQCAWLLTRKMQVRVLSPEPIHAELERRLTFNQDQSGCRLLLGYGVVLINSQTELPSPEAETKSRIAVAIEVTGGELVGGVADRNDILRRLGGEGTVAMAELDRCVSGFARGRYQVLVTVTVHVGGEQGRVNVASL